MPMRYTPFDSQDHGRAFIRSQGHDLQDDLAFLAAHGIALTANLWQADLFLLCKYPVMDRRARWLLRLLRWKPALIWTDEPRYVPVAEPRMPPQGGLPALHVMNVYTGDVFLSNITMFGWAINRRLPYVEEARLDPFPERSVAALATYIADPERQRFVLNGRDIDLVMPRQELILAGHRRGMVDVYGRNWPDGISRAVSRDGDWYTAKLDVLQHYRFNICLENTNYAYYCTEKIWDSIRGGCLPIYYGAGNRIYEDFPRGSFIDYADFTSPEALFAYIAQMSRREYCERMNRCIEVYNRLYERHDFVAQRERSLLKIVEKVRMLVA